MMVLVCDDMETDRALMRKALTDLGHVVELAKNGVEAIEKAKASKPAVIFLDVVMPDLDGFATCRKLKADPATASIPVIIVSSKATPTDKFWAEKQGAAAHVAKPWAPSDISAALRLVGPR